MLEEFSRYQNLGSPNYFLELFSKLISEKKWTKDNIKAYFNNRIIDDYSVFDGGLLLAEKLGFIKTRNKFIYINSEYNSFLINKKYLKFKIIENLFLNIKEDDEFYDIFSPENISYDIVYHSIQINKSAFKFKYTSLRNLLLDFGFLMNHPISTSHKLIVNPSFNKFFDKFIIFEIKKRKMSIDELEKILRKNSIYGEEAEKFVLEYERERLSSHPSIKNIQNISKYDSSAGYDIISYKNISSKELDRFIEVKSYFQTPSFHWSRNEIEVSKTKKDNYFLYLVDREQINNDKYKPIIISNPYKNVLNKSEWIKRIEEYFVIHE